MDLERNDARGAVATFERELDAGTFNEDLGEMLVMMQDDPEEYFELLEGVWARRQRDGKPLPG